MRKRQSVKNKTNSRVNGDEFKGGGNSLTVLLLLDPLPLQFKDVTNVPVIILYLSSLQTPQR